MLDRLTAATKEAVAAIKEQVMTLPRLHLDETGLRVDGSLHWLHCACDEKWSYFSLQKRRGAEAMDKIGILPEYENLMVHDCWAPYNKYGKAEHALCVAHIVRELVYVEEELKQSWARDLKILLLEALHKRHELEAVGKTAFLAEQLTDFCSRYDACVQAGIAENPLPEQIPGKRGRPLKGKIRALLERLQISARRVLL